jgi:cob(I)alamin adenosyltransferase
VSRAIAAGGVSYNQRVKIYTKTGDHGETGLFDGTRVSKADARVDAYGEVDEVNSAIGLARAHCADAGIAAVLEALQRALHAVGAVLADPRRQIAGRVTKAAMTDADATRLEETIDRFEGELPPLRRFILAGGTPVAAALHLARTICRRAERRIVALDLEPADEPVLAYMNRLSDLLFVLARAVNHRAGLAETEW